MFFPFHWTPRDFLLTRIQTRLFSFFDAYDCAPCPLCFFFFFFFFLGDSSSTCRRTDVNVRFLRHCEQCFRRNASFAFESTRPASGQNQHRFNAASRSTSGALERSGKAGRANSGAHSASVAEYRSSSVASKQMIASLTPAELAAALERWSTNHPLRHRLVVDELRRQHSNLTAEIRASVVERDRVKRAVQHRWLCALYARFDL